MGLLETISKQTGMQKPTIVKFAFGGLIAFVVFGIGQAILTTLLGVAYPVFMSFHALENDSTQADDKQWLTYWVVFGLFNMIDQFAGFVLHFIPFYYVLKLAVLIWLFHPKSVGATWVYNNYIQEYATHLIQIEADAKKGIADIANKAKEVVGMRNKVE